MPKISKVSQLILILGILIIAFVALYMVWNGQGKELKTLKEELAKAQLILAKPPPPKIADLENQIQTAQNELQAAEVRFPKSDQALEIADSLYLLAKSKNLKVAGMSDGLSTAKKNNIEYNVISIELELRGQISDILGFVARLETELPTAEITRVTLKKAATVQELDTGTVGINILCGRKS